MRIKGVTIHARIGMMGGNYRLPEDPSSERYRSRHFIRRKKLFISGDEKNGAAKSGRNT
jgi:hypothetical protein